LPAIRTSQRSTRPPSVGRPASRGSASVDRPTAGPGGTVAVTDRGSSTDRQDC
jgi:hypothetical protein